MTNIHFEKQSSISRGDAFWWFERNLDFSVHEAYVKPNVLKACDKIHELILSHHAYQVNCLTINIALHT